MIFIEIKEFENGIFVRLTGQAEIDKPPYVQPTDDSDLVDLSLTRNLVKQIDPVVGTGPRDLNGGHLLALHDVDIHIEGSNNGTPLDALQRLGDAVYSGELPWIMAALNEGILTPLLKTAIGKKPDQ